MPRKATTLLAAAVAVGVFGTAAAAQQYPTRPITILVPFAPGGSSDTGARLVAQKLNSSFGQPVIVENKTGANGQIAVNALKSAPADGHTLLWVSHGIVAINPSLYTKLSYDPIADFAPISLAFRSTHVLLVPTSSPYKTPADLVEAARKNPGKLRFASAGMGSGSHLAGEMLKAHNRLDVFHVPYRGSTAALPDLVAGRIDFFFDGPANSVPLVLDGKLRALAVTDYERFAQIPNVPTMAEAGLKNHEINSWFGFVARAGVSRAIVNKLHAEISKALQSPDVAQKIVSTGGTPAPSKSPEEFAAFFVSEKDRLGKLVIASGAKVD
jgi:tripartite-type tricarboxylate transporter receptor subunit TctC